jgi:molybdopterin biosynthesis enzyme
MSGLSSSNLWTIIKARMAERLVFTEFIPFKKVTFVRVVRTPMGIVARPFTGESALLGIVVKSNGFIITPENRTMIEEGEEVDVHLLPTPLPYDFLRE